MILIIIVLFNMFMYILAFTISIKKQQSIIIFIVLLIIQVLLVLLMIMFLKKKNAASDFIDLGFSLLFFASLHIISFIILCVFRRKMNTKCETLEQKCETSEQKNGNI